MLRKGLVLDSKAGRDCVGICGPLFNRRLVCHGKRSRHRPAGHNVKTNTHFQSCNSIIYWQRPLLSWSAFQMVLPFSDCTFNRHLASDTKRSALFYVWTIVFRNYPQNNGKRTFLHALAVQPERPHHMDVTDTSRKSCNSMKRAQ